MGIRRPDFVSVWISDRCKCEVLPGERSQLEYSKDCSLALATQTKSSVLEELQAAEGSGGRRSVEVSPRPHCCLYKAHKL